jgi:hypothetical protein
MSRGYTFLNPLHTHKILVSSKQSATRLATCFLLVVCLAYPFTVKTEVVSSFEMSVNFYQTTQHHIPEDRHVQGQTSFH